MAPVSVRDKDRLLPILITHAGEHDSPGLTAGSNNSDLNPYGVAAVAALVGLFSKQATDKLREIFDTAFRVKEGGDDARADSLTNPKPVLTQVRPPSLTVLQPISMSLIGSRFVANSEVHLVPEGGTEVVRAAKFVSDQLLDVELQAEDVAQAGKLNISVVNPAPGGGTSTPLDVTVAAASP